MILQRIHILYGIKVIKVALFLYGNHDVLLRINVFHILFAYTISISLTIYLQSHQPMGKEAPTATSQMMHGYDVGMNLFVGIDVCITVGVIASLSIIV
jgi:hypothetical protein